MDKEKTVIIDIGSNCREFRTTVKATPEKMRQINEELRHIVNGQHQYNFITAKDGSK